MLRQGSLGRSNIVVQTIPLSLVMIIKARTLLEPKENH